MNVTGFLKQALPWIGAAATGNVPALVSLAAQTVAQHVGKAVTANADDIAAAVAGATPDQIVALKQADNDFALKMQQLGFEHIEDMLKLEDDDRANARARQVSLKDRVPAILAIAYTAGFFLYLGMLLKFSPPAADKDLLEILLGALSAGEASIMAYYFGSSAAHDKLTATLGDKS